MKWDTSELEALARDLGTAGAKAGRMADLAVRKAGLDAVRIAQANAPVDTGFHSSSIGMDSVGPGVVEFGPTSSYGAHLEYGTHRMRARPHINPAADAVADELEKAIAALSGGLL